MAYGMYLLNPKSSPAKKSRRRGARRRKNRSLTKSNPMKKSRRRRRSFATRNPARKRRARRSRRLIALNPKRRSRRFSRRNPARSMRRVRRGRSFSRRNPSGDIFGTFTSPDMLTVAGGVVVGTLGSNLIVNKLATTASTQKLPGLDPAKPSAFARTLYKGLIAGGTGYLLRAKAPRFSEGLMLGAVAVVISDLLSQSGVLTQIQTAAGVSRYYGARGVGYLPGTNTRFTGPAQRFLTRNNAPRPGMGAAIGPNFMRKTVANAEGAFTGAN